MLVHHNFVIMLFCINCCPGFSGQKKESKGEALLSLSLAVQFRTFIVAQREICFAMAVEHLGTIKNIRYIGGGQKNIKM